MPVARAVDRTGTPLLALRGVSTATGLRDVDLELHAGEILGLAGLMGSGRSELARAVFGIDPLTAGEIRLRGEPVAHPPPRRRDRARHRARPGGPAHPGPRARRHASSAT